MGQYATSGTGNISANTQLPAALWPGDEVYLFGTSFVAASGPTPGQIQAPNDANVQFETVTVGERSLSAALAPRPGGGQAAGISVLVVASANPGAAEIDVQVSPSDSDGTYLTPSNSAYKLTTWTAAGNGQFFAWTELQPSGDNFISLKVIANPNSVKFTAKLSYV